MKLEDHKNYNSLVKKWKFIDDFYEGDPHDLIAAGHLIKHKSESKNTPEANAQFAERTSRAANNNELEAAIEVHASHLSQIINFGELLNDPAMTEIILDANGFSESSQNVFEEAIKIFLKYDRVAYIIEAPEVSADLSKAEEKTIGARSYHKVIEPYAVRNWEYFLDGVNRGKLKTCYIELEPIKIAEKTKRRVDVYEVKLDNQLRINGYVKTTFVETDSENEFEVEGEAKEGAIDRIPITIIGHGRSRFYKIALSNKKLFNDGSVLDNVLYYQGFKWHIITGVKPDDIKSRAEFKVTTIDNENASVHSIEEGNPEALFKAIDKREQRTRRAAMFDVNALTSDDSKQQQSVESKEHDAKGRVKFYDRVITSFETKLNEVFQTHAQFEGYAGEFKITIAREFGLDDTNKDILESTTVFNLAKDIGAVEVQKSIVIQMIKKMKSVSEEEKEKLIASVEKAQAPTSLSPFVSQNRPSVFSQIP